jgi:hypothetical protein
MVQIPPSVQPVERMAVRTPGSKSARAGDGNRTRVLSLGNRFFVGGPIRRFPWSTHVSSCCPVRPILRDFAELWHGYGTRPSTGVLAENSLSAASLTSELATTEVGQTVSAGWVVEAFGCGLDESAFDGALEDVACSSIREAQVNVSGLKLGTFVSHCFEQQSYVICPTCRRFGAVSRWGCGWLAGFLEYPSDSVVARNFSQHSFFNELTEDWRDVFNQVWSEEARRQHRVERCVEQHGGEVLVLDDLAELEKVHDPSLVVAKCDFRPSVGKVTSV